MSLRDEIPQIAATSKVQAILDGTLECSGKPFTSDELTELQEILRDKTVQDAQLESLFQKRGYDVSSSSIRRFRKRLNVSK